MLLLRAGVSASVNHDGAKLKWILQGARVSSSAIWEGGRFGASALSGQGAQGSSAGRVPTPHA